MIKNMVLIFCLLSNISSAFAITSTDLAPDCPLVPPKLDDDVNSLKQNMQNHFDSLIRDLEAKREEINNCFGPGTSESALKANLIQKIAQDWAPKSVPIGLTILGTSIVCTGKEEFRLQMVGFLMDLKQGTIKPDDISGSDALKDTYESCSNRKDEEYRSCINKIILDPNSALRSTWETKCSKQFDLNKNAALIDIVKKTVSQDLKNQTVTTALDFAYKELNKIIAPNRLPGKSESDCSEAKTTLATTSISLLKAGTGLLAAAGPPLASLGSLLATGPITNLFKNMVNGTKQIKDYSTSSGYLNANAEDSLTFYTCALYAAQKARCRISQEHEDCSIQNDQTRLAEEISPLKNLFESFTGQTQRGAGTDGTYDDNANVETARHFYDDNANVETAQLFYNLFFKQTLKYIQPSETLFGHLSQFEEKLLEISNKPIIENKTPKIEENEIIAAKDLKNKLSNLISKSKTFSECFNNLGQLIKICSKVTTLKDELNVFFKDFPPNLNRVPELTFYKSMFDAFNGAVELKEREISADQVQAIGNNFYALNKVLNSIFINNDIVSKIEDDIKKISNENLSNKVGLQKRLRFCLSGLQWRSHPHKKITDAYKKACGFLDFCEDENNTIGLMEDWKNLSLPSTSDTETKSYQPICDTNIRLKSILDRAMKNFKEDIFCGKNPRIFEAKNGKK